MSPISLAMIRASEIMYPCMDTHVANLLKFGVFVIKIWCICILRLLMI